MIINNFLLREQSLDTKKEAYNLIQMDQIYNYKLFCQQNNFKPNEELSEKGQNWTVIHYACQLKKPNILMLLLQ